MKKLFLIIAILFSSVVFSQEMKVHKTNGNVESFLLSQIDSITFNISSIIPTQGLVAYYPFNGNANDESGNGNNGITTGTTLSTDRFGNSNKAYSFNGSNNYITVNNSLLSNTFSSFTISCWIQTTMASGPGQIIADRFTTGYPYKYSMMNQSNGTVTAGSHDGGSNTNNVISTPVNIGNGQWRHIIVVLDASLLKYGIYIDGTFNIEITNINTGAWSSLSNPTSIGVSRGPSGYDFANWFSGKLDDIRVYNRALSASEISQLYHESGWVK